MKCVISSITDYEVVNDEEKMEIAYCMDTDYNNGRRTWERGLGCGFWRRDSFRSGKQHAAGSRHEYTLKTG